MSTAAIQHCRICVMHLHTLLHMPVGHVRMGCPIRTCPTGISCICYVAVSGSAVSATRCPVLQVCASRCPVLMWAMLRPAEAAAASTVCAATTRCSLPGRPYLPTRVLRHVRY
eukprot:488319-Rhodomonas_salina.4